MKLVSWLLPLMVLVLFFCGRTISRETSTGQKGTLTLSIDASGLSASSVLAKILVFDEESRLVGEIGHVSVQALTAGAGTFIVQGATSSTSSIKAGSADVSLLPGNYTVYGEFDLDGDGTFESANNEKGILESVFLSGNTTLSINDSKLRGALSQDLSLSGQTTINNATVYCYYNLPGGDGISDFAHSLAGKYSKVTVSAGNSTGATTKVDAVATSYSTYCVADTDADYTPNAPVIESGVDYTATLPLQSLNGASALTISGFQLAP